MIAAKLYTFYDLPFSHDVCHLFEHIVIRRFLLSLRAAGRSRAFIGNVDGNTVESTIFFHAELYSAEDIALFEQSLYAEQSSINQRIVAESLAHIEAELMTVVNVQSDALLMSQLAACQRIVGGATGAHVSADDPLIIAESPKLFDTAVLAIETSDASDEATRSFFCFYPALLDIARDSAFDAAAAYPQQNGVFTAYQDGNVVLQQFTVKKPFDFRAAEKRIAHHFHEARVTNEILELLVRVLKTHPAYTAVPMYFYEKTLTRTTRDELAQSITPQAFHDIAKSARISIQPVPPTK
jgi:hypothetical protein cdivTM_09431